ncbi:TPM domain-containing protein [Candidatus Microgenomates bacterium]|nr:TPM domain-containing protein [Candidatus Microgenomates bacterium]
MENIKRLFIVLVILFSLVWPFKVLAADFPEPVGYVNDFGKMFSSEFGENLEKRLSDFEKETTVEIAIVTIESLADYTVEEYAVRLFEQWKIGKKEKDNSLLLLSAKEERKVRIEVGYGLEPVITDGRAGRIIREKIVPSFKKENYEQGIELAVVQIEEYIKTGEPPEGGEAVQETVSSFFVFFIIGGMLLIWVTAFLGRTKEFVTGGVIGGLLGGFFGLVMGGLASIFKMTLVLGIIGLVLDYFFSKNYKKLKEAGKSTGFWASRGGFSSKSSSSSSSFGGFGGGSSGGGGASGGW